MFTQMWHRTLPKRGLKWDTLEQEGGKSLKVLVRVALSCAVSEQTPELSLALVPPAHHQLGHGHLSSGGALGQQWWNKVLGPHNTNEVVLITLGNGLCI